MDDFVYSHTINQMWVASQDLDTILNLYRHLKCFSYMSNFWQTLLRAHFLQNQSIHPEKNTSQWALGSKARLSHFKALSMLSLLMPHFCQKNAFAWHGGRSLRNVLLLPTIQSAWESHQIWSNQVRPSCRHLVVLFHAPHAHPYL